MKFGIRGQLTDVITCVKFFADRFRGYGVLTPPKLPFPIDLLRRPYNSVALPCDTVIAINSTRGAQHFVLHPAGVALPSMRCFWFLDLMV